MWALPATGIKPMSPAVAGGFFTIEPPGKPRDPWVGGREYPGEGLASRGCFLSPGPRCTHHALTPSPHTQPSPGKNQSTCCQPSRSKWGHLWGMGLGHPLQWGWALVFVKRGSSARKGRQKSNTFVSSVHSMEVLIVKIQVQIPAPPLADFRQVT